MEYIAMVRHEFIPLCQRMVQRLDEQNDKRGKTVGIQTLDNLDNLNAVAKDTLAVLATEKVSKRDSIFSFSKKMKTKFNK